MAPDRSAWERRTEWALIVAALVFLVAYAWPILDPDLPEPGRRVASLTVTVVWVVFGVDYVVRLAGAADRRRWFVRHLPDLAILVLPLLRPLQLLRLLTLVQVLNRSAAGRLRGRVALYVVSGAVVLAAVAALAVLDAERGARGALITTYGDALWWAAATMSTVGYGDVYPVTGTGRVVGVLLMIGGITLLGTVTATLASWLVEAVRDEQDESTRELDALRVEVARLSARLEASDGSDTRGS
ncbi:potassium channel family protein [uncultured Nocardioides sp.]|uniref:potassium channel family protein n=1 Tax=uncultured Nocardioides sp. TaxID=198441 RepID=UPI00261856E0|nr:potassium channel family protein [uncultured Nocardioides sp.]